MQRYRLAKVDDDVPPQVEQQQPSPRPNAEAALDALAPQLRARGERVWDALKPYCSLDFDLNVVYEAPPLVGSSLTALLTWLLSSSSGNKKQQQTEV